MILIAIFFPGISFLVRGKIISGILCIILQVVLIGWLPASIWAVASIIDGRNNKRVKQMETRMTGK